jgi:hypothetical protein
MFAASKKRGSNPWIADSETGKPTGKLFCSEQRMAFGNAELVHPNMAGV